MIHFLNFYDMQLKWKNSRLDPLPGHKTPVYIAVLGVYYTAVYDAHAQHFIASFDGEHAAVPVSTVHLYWTEAPSA